MKTRMQTVTGIFDRRGEAERAVNRLVELGFSTKDISLLVSDKTKGMILGEGTAEGAGVGGTIGGALGAVIGGLAAVGAVAIPGIGLLAAGPIVAVLAGAGIGGAAGTFVGGLVGLGLSASDAEEIQRRLGAGAIVVAVHANELQVQNAMSILRGQGGHQVQRHI